MVEKPEQDEREAVHAALCVDRDAFRRFGSVLRHLAVGMVDQAVAMRILSPDPRVERLRLGPIQTTLYPRMTWPFAGRRLNRLIGAWGPHPPTVVHAITGECFGVAVAIAEAFDADLIIQLTSLADCDAVLHIPTERVGRFVASSTPLHDVLVSQLHIGTDRIELIRPGVLAADRPACFARGRRTCALVCTADLESDSGIEALIHAVAALRAREQDVVMFLLGQGQQESALRRLVQKVGLLPHVTFANPRGDVGHVLAGSDVFVRPSVDHAFFAGSLQAMAAGMAVITCTNTVADHLLDQKTAIVVRETTPDGLATAVEQLLVDRELGRRLAATALEHVRTHHAMNTMAEKTATMYRRMAVQRATFPITG